MKGLLSKAPGGPETLVLDDLPDPVAAPGQVVVAVKACSINYPDVLIIEDKYQFKPPRPFAPGSGDRRRGRERRRWRDRLAARRPRDRHDRLGRAGREGRGCPPHALYRLPEGRSFEEGSALLLTYATTIHALLDRGHLKAGRQSAGAGRGGRRRAGRGRARQGVWRPRRRCRVVRGEGAGLPRVPAPTRPSSMAARRSTRTSRRRSPSSSRPRAGATVSRSSTIRSAATMPSRRCARSGGKGRYLVVGFPAGIPKLPLNLTLLKSCDVCGVFWGAFAAR